MGKQTRYCYVDEATGRMLDAPIERVLACYKACEGINPEVVPKLLEACRQAQAVNQASYREAHARGCGCDRCGLANVLSFAIAKATKGD